MMKIINDTEDILITCKILWVQARIKYACISGCTKEKNVYYNAFVVDNIFHYFLCVHQSKRDHLWIMTASKIQIICKYLHFQYDRKFIINRKIFKLIKISSFRKGYFKLISLIWKSYHAKEKKTPAIKKKNH